jgi:hypothetical protein
MVQATTKLTGHQAVLMRFDEMTYNEEFDGVWACASLLHVRQQNLTEILRRIMRAIKIGGLFYCSFKYGVAERLEAGRFFNDQDEASFKATVSNLRDVELLSLWITNDVRPDRNQQWLNAIVRRNEKPPQPPKERFPL